LFVHEDHEFEELLQIVAAENGLAVGLIEKDYWVTHALWAIQDQGFEIWLKGGASLSKGFDLITRFSEDLDLKLEPGVVEGVESVNNWKSTGTKATGERRAYFEQLSEILKVPGAPVLLEVNLNDKWLGARFQVQYPSRHSEGLGPMRPFVLLEIGSARVAPFVESDMTSFVHRYLQREGRLAEFDENEPIAVRCLHPLVTLVEKLEAIHRRAKREERDPAGFVRHYEDAARIVEAEARLPSIAGYTGIGALVAEMLAAKDIGHLPTAEDFALNPDDSVRWDAIRDGYEQIAPMFWGERIPIEDACAQLREWVRRHAEEFEAPTS